MGLLLILLEISIDQLNALVNFELALLRLDGQFSVGVNTVDSIASKLFG